MTTRVRSTELSRRPVAQHQREQQRKHKARQDRARRTNQVVSSGAREMRVSKQSPVVVEAHRLLPRKSSDKKRLDQHP
jgi:hypothetical protein